MNEYSVELLAEYASAIKRKTKQKRLAELERDLWASMLVEKSVAELGERRDWFKATYGGKPSSYSIRSAVLSLGTPCCDQIFDLVDAEKISLHKAGRISRLARQVARANGVTIIQALDHVLQKTKDGTKALNRMEQAPAVVGVEIPAGLDLRGFKHTVKKLGRKFINESLRGLKVDDVDKDRIVGEFEISLDMVMDQLSQSIRIAKRDVKDQALTVVGKRAFEDACSVLGIYDEEYGKPIDLRRVYRNHKRRSFQLHPDRNGNKQARTKAEFEAVQDARKTLDYYAQQVGARGEKK